MSSRKHLKRARIRSRNRREAREALPGTIAAVGVTLLAVAGLIILAIYAGPRKPRLAQESDASVSANCRNVTICGI